MKKKKVMIIAMCLAILLMIVGYSLFQTKLIINGTSEVTSSWKVYFSEIINSNGTETASEAMTPRLTNTTMEFAINLGKPGDSYTYVVLLVNEGTIGAIINDINANSTGSAGVDYTITGIKKGDKLAAGASKVVTIKMTYDASLTAIPEEKVNELVINISCVQDDGQTIDNEDIVISKLALLTDSIKKNSPPQSDANIDFSKISSDTNGKGLYYTSKNTEGNKKTYYFRGAVDNNFVKLGNLYFRIVRINEDGSVRLIYHGTQPGADLGGLSIIQASDAVYNKWTGDASFVGYMTGSVGSFTEYSAVYYNTNTGTSYHSHPTSSTIKVASSYSFDKNEGMFTLVDPVDGSYTSTYNNYYTCMSNAATTCTQMAQIEVTATSGSNYVLTGAYIYNAYFSTSYSNATDNTHSSQAKTKLEEWYQNNLLSYASLMADTGFCNDRSLYSGNGYGKNSTIYAIYNRLQVNKTPQFKCTKSNDLFTTVSSSDYKGNRKLTYPVGLITADEVAYAGGVWGTQNTSYYLNINQHFYTMTPYASQLSALYPNAYMVGVSNNGYIGQSTVQGSIGLRPVINLKSSTKITGGVGTSADPYVIKID